MSRFDKDHYKDGEIFNGFDYDLQVWVKNGIVQICGHLSPECGCNQRKYAELPVARARILEALETKRIAEDHLKESKGEL